MYKKFINAISSIKPEYDSLYEVIHLKHDENDYMVYYRMHGKSGINKIRLTYLVNDDALLNNFSGATVRNLTACAMKTLGSDYSSIQSSSMDCSEDKVNISLHMKNNDRYNDINLNEIMADGKKLTNLSKKEIARLYWLAGYKEGYEEHALEQSFILNKEKTYESCEV